MKICIVCKIEFKKSDWECPNCSWCPKIVDGFPAFSPELANHNDGLPEDAHHHLDKLQEGSFWFRIRNQLIQDGIKKFFPFAQDVLEIGCGSGYVLQGIRQALPDAHLTASEIFSYGLSYASKRVSPPTQFLQLDARSLPFKREFDLIGAFDVLEHIEEDELVIKNIRHALKENGGVIFTVPQHPFLWSKVDEISCHKRRYTSKQLTNLLKHNGFTILRDTSFMFFLLPFMLIQRLTRAKRDHYNSLNELKLPNLLDKTFGAMLSLERQMIKFGLSFPIGGSRLVIATLGEDKNL